MSRADLEAGNIPGDAKIEKSIELPELCPIYHFETREEIETLIEKGWS